MTKADRLLWSELAEDDLQSIWLYLADEVSDQVADDQLRGIKARCQTLLPYPLKGKAREELGPGIRSFVILPYVAFYRVTSRAI